MSFDKMNPPPQGVTNSNRLKPSEYCSKKKGKGKKRNKSGGRKGRSRSKGGSCNCCPRKSCGSKSGRSKSGRSKSGRSKKGRRKSGRNRSKKSKGKGKRCHKPGPSTRNPFLNFLREYRKRHCGMTIKQIAIEGAKTWCQMSREERQRYYTEACKMQQRKRKHEKKGGGKERGKRDRGKKHRGKKERGRKRDKSTESKSTKLDSKC